MAGVLILGAGVSGLSTGIRLLEAGHKVTIWAKDLPPNTTSNQAAAIWWPYLCYPREKAIQWAKHSLRNFKEKLVPDAASGCDLIRVRDLYDHPVGEPWWANAVDHWAKLDTSKLPPGYADGYEAESIVVDTSIYMQYLVDWYQRLGGKIERHEVNDVQEGFEETDVIINCTGLGSRELFGDTSVFPIRGQVARIKHNGFNEAIFDDEGPNGLAYIIPRRTDIVLGGTAQENNWDESIRPSDTQEILRKAAALHPALSDVEIVSQAVGLRPGRPAVRLEAEHLPGGTVIHNYGHGGAGFTLSWGCAEEVCALVG